MPTSNSEADPYQDTSEAADDIDENCSDSDGTDTCEYEEEDDDGISERGEGDENDIENRMNIETFREGIKRLLAALDGNSEQSQKFQQDLLARYEAFVCPQSKRIQDAIPIRARNILFKYAYDGQDAHELPSLIKAVVQKHPKLLNETDESGSGALHFAIERKSEWFIRAILESDIPEEDMQRALDPNGLIGGQKRIRENCIHTAIRRNLRPSLTMKLIERASKHTLDAQNEKMLTPLHLAVDYTTCTSIHRSLVNTLLKLGDRALDKRTAPPDCYSVYQYLEKTWGKATQDLKDRKNESRKLGKSHDSGLVSSRNIKGSSEKFTTDNRRRQQTALQERQNELIHALMFGSLPRTDPYQEQQQFAPKLPDYDKSPDAKNATSESKATKKNSERFSKPKISSANEIAKDLKLHYFRSTFDEESGRSHASAEWFIFGDNTDCKLICFDFPANSRNGFEKIDFDQFKESYKRFVFDPVLLYVNFRRLDLQLPDNPRAIKLNQDAGIGKKDMEKFFHWLRKEKHVQNIIKVTVEDRQEIPHCDQAIVNSLKNLDIEILDWRKFDLCPLVIQEAANKSDNLRELHLWWSGTNAVLRAWSEPQGLAEELKNLKRIHIYESKPLLDSIKRTDEAFKAFRTRLNTNRPAERQIEVVRHPFKDSDKYSEIGSTVRDHRVRKVQGVKKIDEHQWLTIMDTFADAIRQLPRPKTTFDNDPTPEMEPIIPPQELEEPVKVALIDDGVDFMHPAISEKLLPGKSFDSGFGTGNILGVPEPYHGSTTGHGTFMAYMIQRVCPAVKIFVYKIDVLQKSNESATFTAKSAADAVEDAVKRKFDIISMSWTVQLSENDSASNNSDLARLKVALQNASNRTKEDGKETLLFCSAPDIGQSNLNNTHFPFNCDGVPNMFRIGAAKADGTIYPWVGNQVGFILPGEDVRMRPSDRVRQLEDPVPKTGSSVATALAAGLAAMIIHCIKLGALYNCHRQNPAGVSLKSVKAIQSFSAMMKAFTTISKNSLSNNNDQRLGVETFFKTPGKDLGPSSGLSEEEKWIRVAGLARDLISDNTENATR